MKFYQLLLAIMLLSFANFAKAAPKKETDCAQCLTKAQVLQRDKDRARIKKEREDLKAEVARLKEENELLRNRPEAVATIPVEYPRASQQVAEPRAMKSNIISALAGWGPGSITNRRKDAQGGNELKIENGIVVGGMYQHIFADTVAVGAGLTVPTVPDTKRPTYFGSVGLGF